MSDAAVLDEALERLADAGPDLRNGFTNHAPMAVEALCTLGRSDAVMPWLRRYEHQLLPWPSPGTPVDPAAWRKALGHPERATDWRALFTHELDDDAWPTVVERWTARLAPGLCAAATHGVIRVGHAVRALDRDETPPRRAELAAALAAWASTYQELPTSREPTDTRGRPGAAIDHVPIVPEDERRFTGTITGALEALEAAPGFPPVIALADLEGEADAVLSELSGTFARVYLANAHDWLSTIVFVHGLTSLTAARSLVPHLAPDTRNAVLRRAWQASAALYAAFGRRPRPDREPAERPGAADELIERAIDTGDEHAIKFTEACLREHALAPGAPYLAAASHAVEMLASSA